MREIGSVFTDKPNIIETDLCFQELMLRLPNTGRAWGCKG
jgi:hypothetical protein